MSSPTENTDKNETAPTQTSSSSSPTKQQQHTSFAAQAQFITSVNRDCGTNVAAANIGEIIQEEDEEEEEEEEEEQEQVEQKEIKQQSTKFTLEPVILATETNDDSNRFTSAVKSNDNEIILAGGLFTVNKINDKQLMEEIASVNNNNNITEQTTSASANKEDSNETVEIRVEEGYATRQMDEYFRQTIAAIKEELTKKLNNEKKDQQQQISQKRNRYDNDEINNDDFNNSDSDFDEFDSNYYLDSDNDSNGDDNDDPEKQQLKKSINLNRLNNNQLYNHLIYSRINETQKQTFYEQLASWLVIFGCILNQFIIDGLCFNYANLFDLIQTDLNIPSRLVASMPIALLICFFLVFAPVSIFLTKTYGSRRIALIGSFISSISLLVSSQMRNIIFFTLFYGIFTGIGISLIYVPSLISISKWFLKKRLLINSIVTVLGACLGAATYPLLSEYLLRKYNLYGALLILSGIQLNCFVGSMLLREPSIPLYSSVFNKFHKTATNTSKKNDKTTTIATKKLLNNKKRSASSTFLIEKEDDLLNSSKKSNEIEMNRRKQPQLNHSNLNKINNISINKKQHKKNDSETESTTSTSTGHTITNYTLKQYWRKFVQTRKSQANTKKNLFHLIAEEKKKTRTLSKTSLEDGFVITTSNNLLAPNDESHVIVSSRQAKLLQSQSIQQQASAQPPHPPLSRTASRFFTRIANSIRSLTTHNNANQQQSPLHTTTNSKNHLDSRTTTLSPPPQSSIELNHFQMNKVIVDSPMNTKKSSQQEQTATTTPLPLIPLMSVFSGPLPETVQNNTTPNEIVAVGENSSKTPPSSTIQLNESTPINNNNNISSSDPQSPPSIPIFNDDINDFDDDDANDLNDDDDDDDDEDDDDDDDDDDEDDDYDYDENEDKEDKEIQAHKKNLRRIVRKNANSNVYKMSRYISYRNSLTNSVRGSLMECSVPEDREETTTNPTDNADIAVAATTDEDNNKSNKRMSIQRKKRLQKRILFEAKNNNSLATTGGDQLKTKSNKKMPDNTTNNNNTNLDVGRNSKTFRMASARRFISTIESSSFFNLPINLETTENNIKNSFINKNKNRRSNNNNNKSVSFLYNNNNNNTDKNTSTLLLLYLGYVTNFKLFLNPLLMILNFSFFLNIIGICIPLIYISEFCKSQGNISKIQSIYMLALIGLFQGVGRVLATIMFKVNESDAKSRIFTHDLTLILAGLSVLLSTVLCDSLLSCSVFAITFGTLYGFNANLRSLFIYDIIGLEWSDDSLFCCVSLAQAVGASVGIPIAGLIYDMTKNYLNVFYFSGVCLICSGLMLTPGRNFRNSCIGSIKRFNKYYFQRK